MTQSPSHPPAGRTFAMPDVVRQFRELVDEESHGGRVHDTVVIGGGAAGAGVLRDIASRGNGSALLVDRGPFGGETSSKTGKAIHPGIRYLRMGFHRLLLAAGLRRDPKIKQTPAQNLRSAWLDLKLVWYGTRERKILMDTTPDTVQEIPNVVFVLPDSPEKKWAVFFGISLYDLFTAVWAWLGGSPRGSRVKLFFDKRALHRELPHLAADSPALAGIQYWDGKASNDKSLVLKAIRDAYYRGTEAHPIRALSFVEVEHYEWRRDGARGYFLVTLLRRFDHDELPERVTVKAHTIANGAGPWLDRVRDRTTRPDGRRSVVYSRGSHLEATNRFIHESLSADPKLQVGLVPLNAERQHYLRPFHQNGIWYVQCTTTDRPHEDPDLVVPMEDEVEELLHSYNELVDDRWKITRSDVFHVFCGIRPLAASDGGEIAVKDLTRMFRITRHDRGGPVFDMVNIKLTEFRWAGREVVEQIAAELRRGGVKKLNPSTTHRLPFLTVEGEERFAVHRADHPRGDREFLREKVRHHVEHQLAYSYEDYLMNAGGIRDAVVFDEGGRCEIDLGVLDLVLAEMAAALGWDAARCAREWDRFAEVYTRNMAHCDLGDRVGDHPGPRAETSIVDTEDVEDAVDVRDVVGMQDAKSGAGD
ncbi:FAD-dependent oxidoreductase [Saccharothrix longispora]|uniref:Glycerol-3-phosphate dehydrogenase n=1 Tax=Saccharothrix longispora TaxID=33920 RepID=A0ABU1PVY4_9PSEU|nr:FAD-dependent oxidoreductase [Saccharothrix longispora]MDR6594784.1 glycerol-3-phosphate dehydrogenase [Saccharothrix longispora]